MKLFNPYNDLIIRAVPFIFNKLIENKEINESELDDLFKDFKNSISITDTKKFLNNDNYIKKIIIEPEPEDYKNFLAKDDEKYTLYHDDVKWENNLPIAFSRHEKEYIKLMLEDPEARSFLSEKLIEKISCSLESYDVYHINDNYIEREVMKQDKDENALRSRLLVITEALRKNKKIEYVYESPQGHYEGTASPYKLIYSLRERILRLAACPDNSPDRFILMNIDRFKSINISEMDSTADPNEFYKSQVRRLILEVENNMELKSAERCMRTFSSYKRTTIYNKTNNTFHIEVDFYLFDKPFVIKDIISLGSTVQVIEVKKPGNKKDSFVTDDKLDLRKEIIDKIRKIYNNM